VLYIGVVQAALCDKLGASATVANLPASAYMFGQIAPLFMSWLVPHRLERAIVVWANLMTGTLILLVGVTLALPVSAGVRIGALIIQALVQGFSGSTSHVFMLQCLRRGTTEKGLAEALKRTFGLTPVFAVAGSLGAQYLLKPGFSWLPYPYDFAARYLIAAPAFSAVPCGSRAGLRGRPFVAADLVRLSALVHLARNYSESCAAHSPGDGRRPQGVFRIHDGDSFRV
jgi:hypothetical protein